MVFPWFSYGFMKSPRGDSPKILARGHPLKSKASLSQLLQVPSSWISVSATAARRLRPWWLEIIGVVSGITGNPWFQYGFYVFNHETYGFDCALKGNRSGISCKQMIKYEDKCRVSPKSMGLSGLSLGRIARKREIHQS